jgi:hypothetical protein
MVVIRNKGKKVSKAYYWVRKGLSPLDTRVLFYMITKSFLNRTKRTDFSTKLVKMREKRQVAIFKTKQKIFVDGISYVTSYILPSGPSGCQIAFELEQFLVNKALKPGNSSSLLAFPCCKFSYYTKSVL